MPRDKLNTQIRTVKNVLRRGNNISWLASSVKVGILLLEDEYVLRWWFVKEGLKMKEFVTKGFIYFIEKSAHSFRKVHHLRDGFI